MEIFNLEPGKFETESVHFSIDFELIFKFACTFVTTVFLLLKKKLCANCVCTLKKKEKYRLQTYNLFCPDMNKIIIPAIPTYCFVN